MCKRGNDQPIDVGNDLFHCFAFFRRHGWKLRLQISGLDLREHRQVFNVLEVFRDPVNQLMAKAAKVFLAHVAQGGRKLWLWLGHGAAV